MRYFFSLLKDQKGSTLPFIGATLLVLVGAVGAAIDVGRGSLLQARLSSSLDAAGLAAGATINTTDLHTEVSRYMQSNFLALQQDTTLDDLQVTANADNTVITLSATASTPTAIMRVLGQESMTVSASSEITRENKGLELVLVLDNTGSMGGSPLASLKTAAADMINILYGTRTTVENLWIGIVPFSQTVNVGSTRTAWIDTAYRDSLQWGSTSWGGCVDARTAGLDVTDDLPSTQLFRPYYWSDHNTYNNWITSGGSYDFSGGKGPNRFCPRPVTPLTADRPTLLNAINAMQAEGNTHVNLGAVWGWRMLSPRWRGQWGGEMDSNSLPLDYNTPLMNKAVVIMTDGENTMSPSVRTAYGYLTDGLLGSTSNSSVARAQLDARLSQICASMKAQNVLVYTIAFRNPGTSIQNLLRNCATVPDYYFNSPTNASLQTAFRAIGDSLANLRVSR